MVRPQVLQGRHAIQQLVARDKGLQSMRATRWLQEAHGGLPPIQLASTRHCLLHSSHVHYYQRYSYNADPARFSMP